MGVIPSKLDEEKCLFPPKKKCTLKEDVKETFYFGKLIYNR